MLEMSRASQSVRLRGSMKSMRYGLDSYSFCLMASGHLDIAMDDNLFPFMFWALGAGPMSTASVWRRRRRTAGAAGRARREG